MTIDYLTKVISQQAIHMQDITEGNLNMLYDEITNHLNTNFKDHLLIDNIHSINPVKISQSDNFKYIYDNNVLCIKNKFHK